jgi:hypothetical protein
MKKDPAVLYKERNKRFDEAIALKIPDRVPMEISFGYFPAAYSGYTCEIVNYDYDRWLAACKKVLSEMGEDMSRVQPFFPGQVLELIAPKNMAWPGHGTSPLHSHQSVECELMQDSEYDLLLNDHSDFMLRYYLPRVSETMQPLSRLPSLAGSGYGYMPVISLAEALARPEVAAAIERLQKAGRLMEEWRPKMQAFQAAQEALGFPPYTKFYSQAPFDAISDHLRGMKGSMFDLYRHPDKILETCDMVLKKNIAKFPKAVPGAINRCGIPLHRGSEGFMSIKQFEKFYWPTLKALIIALVEKGYTPCVAFEGDYPPAWNICWSCPKARSWPTWIRWISSKPKTC